MGKERLEKAKKILNHIKGYGVYDGNDDIEIFEWLIEQAERVQEYEYTEKYQKQLFDQNKRYREALMTIAVGDSHFAKYEDIARQALEGEE